MSTSSDDVGKDTGTVVGTQTSDIRVKRDVTPMTYGLAEVLALDPISFAYTYGPGDRKVGLSAQAVAEIVPEAVYDTGGVRDDIEHILAMDYSALVPVLINAVKELTARVAQLEGAA
jgi:hypothetical protein